MIHKKKTFIIAELSANHNNDYNLAVKTIHAMAKSGADAVKVQTYKPESLSLNLDTGFFGPRTSGFQRCASFTKGSYNEIALHDGHFSSIRQLNMIDTARRSIYLAYHVVSGSPIVFGYGLDIELEFW